MLDVSHSAFVTWMTVAHNQHGAISRSQLRGAGLSDDRIDGLLQAGVLVQQRRKGVFCAAVVNATDLTRCWTAVLAARATLSHLSAARIWGIEVPGDGRVHVTAPDRRMTRMPAGVRVHRVLLPPGAVVQRDGLPIIERSRTVLDCLGLLSRSSARKLFDRALQQEWITVDGVRRRLDDEPRRRGNVMLRLLLDEGTEGDAPSERLLMQLLRDAGIVGWKVGLKVDVGWSVFKVDLGFPLARIALEVDGWANHVDVERFRADRIRTNALTAAGWTVYRFTWDQLVERPWSVVATVRAALARSA